MKIPKARIALAPVAMGIAALALVGGCTTDSRMASRLPTGPEAGDTLLAPFYQWNQTLPAQAGALLRTEPLAQQPEITEASVSQRILYTSLDARWHSGLVPVSGTLHLPKGTAPAGGWPVIAWGHGTLGVADVCAPSWAGHRPRDATYINRWLQQGFAVVATDYQGLGGPGPHPYLIWEAEGRSILDAVRAALAAHPGKLANDLVITGQSQGSGSALGAARIAAKYAPELKLRATIATGVVSTFPDGPAKLAVSAPTHSGPARFNTLRLIGGSLPDGGPTAASLITAKGQPLLTLARRACVDEMRGLEQQAQLDAGNTFSVDPAKLDALMLRVTDMPMEKMATPLFLGTGLADRTIPPKRQYAAAAALCASGNQVTWKGYEGVTHNGIVNAAFDDELAYVRQLQQGRQPAGNCATLAEPGAPGTPTPGIRFND